MKSETSDNEEDCMGAKEGWVALGTRKEEECSFPLGRLKSCGSSCSASSAFPYSLQFS